jgi:hypothetical protein
MKVGIAARFRGLLLHRAGAGTAERDEDQATFQDAQFMQHANAGMGLFALGIDIDQHCLGSLFADPNGSIAVVVAVGYLVPGRQFRLDLPFKILVRGDQADHGQNLVS